MIDEECPWPTCPNVEIVERLKKHIKKLEAWEPPRDTLEEFKKILEGEK